MDNPELKHNTSFNNSTIIKRNKSRSDYYWQLYICILLLQTEKDMWVNAKETQKQDGVLMEKRGE